MIINLNFNLKGLDGKEIQNNNVGQFIAEALAYGRNGNSLKLWHWATKLYAGEELDLDPVDTQTLKDFIETHTELPNITKAQSLSIFK